MIQPRCPRLRIAAGLPKLRQNLIFVKLILLFFILLLFMQSFFTGDYDDQEPPRTLPNVVLNLVSPENASRILDEEIDDFRIRNSSRIPKIIHQIYSSAMIPDVYVQYIRSWVQNHPDHEYWLWDDASSRMLVEKYYSKFLPLFDAYCHDLFRSDVTRYFLLHKFGGMYADMDYVSYKNVEELLDDFQCLVVAENQMQSKVIYRVSDMIMNAWMAGVPGHPYFRFLLNRLPSSASCHFHDVLVSTGPLFLYKARRIYIKITRCNVFENCFVKVLPSDKMMRSWSADAMKIAKRHCLNGKLTDLQVEACEFYKKVNFSTAPAKQGDAFADHMFLHLGNYAKKYKAMKRIHIRDIVPHAIIPSEGKL